MKVYLPYYLPNKYSNRTSENINYQPLYRIIKKGEQLEKRDYLEFPTLGEHLLQVSNCFYPSNSMRNTFLVMSILSLYQIRPLASWKEGDGNFILSWMLFDYYRHRKRSSILNPNLDQHEHAEMKLINIISVNYPIFNKDRDIR